MSPTHAAILATLFTSASSLVPTADAAGTQHTASCSYASDRIAALHREWNWRIVREHNSSRVVPTPEVQALLRAVLARPAQ